MMRLRSLLLITAVLLCAAAADAGVSVVRSDGSGLVLQCSFEPPALSPVAGPGAAYQRYTIPGCFNGVAAGAPALPQAGYLFAMPPGTVPVIVSTKASGRSVIAGIPLPAPAINGDGPAYAPDPAIYRGARPYPAALAQLSQPAWTGDLKVATVVLHPVQFDPTARQVTAVAGISVEIAFVPAASSDRAIAGDAKRTASFPASRAGTAVVNREAAAGWRCYPSSASPEKSAVSRDTLPYKILVNRDGWYAVSYDALAAAGLDPSQVDPRTVKLFCQDREVPLYFPGQQDGTLDPGDRFEFYGQRARGSATFFNQFTDANVYWLTWGGLPGARMAEQDGAAPLPGADSARSFPAQLHLERDSLFVRLKSPESDQSDRWFWKRIDESESYTTALDLSDLDPAAGVVRCRLMLHGFTYLSNGQPDHRAVILLNGQTIADTSWTGQAPCLVTAVVPPSALLAGTNALTLQHGALPGVPIDSYFLNWIEVDYPRRYQAPGGYLEFTAPDTATSAAHRYTISGLPSQNVEIYRLGVSKITGGRVATGPSGLDYSVTFSDRSLGPARYLAVIADDRHVLRPLAIVANAASDLRDPGHRAEYLVIAPQALAPQARQLAALRAPQFQGAMAATTTDIYDEFGQGLASDQAIKDFIRYAYFQYQVPPAYVLLMGGGSYDPKNILGTSKPDYVPIHLSRTDDFGGVPDDEYYVRIVGDDFLADAAIGRLPLNSLADYQGWETKRAGYEQSPFTDQWHRDFLMIAGPKKDAWDDFYTPTDALCAALSPRYTISKVYDRLPGTTTDLIDQFNEGAVLASYYGHGGGQVWGHSSFFTNAEAEGLNNAGRWPLVGGFTCYSGAMDIPDTLSLSQQLFRVPGGAIGVFASSGPSWDNWMEQTFINAVNRRMLRRFGDITVSARLDLYAMAGGDSTGYAAQMMRSFNLLGDPGMRLAVPDSDLALSLSPPAAQPGDSVAAAITGPFPAGSTALLSFTDAAGRIVMQRAFTTGASGAASAWRMPDTAAAGQGWARLYLKQGTRDWAVAAPLVVGGHAVTACRTVPPRPFDSDSIAAWASVYSITGVDPDSVRCEWKYGSAGDTVYGVQQAAMRRVAGDTFTVAAPIPPAGSLVPYLNYRVCVADSGRTWSGGFHHAKVWARPDLVPSADARDTYLGGARRLTLFSKVSNRGETDAAAVPVYFYRDGAKIDSVLVDSIKAGKSVQVAVPYHDGPSPAIIALAVDTAHVTLPPEQDTTNNRTAGLLVPSNGIEYRQLNGSGGSGPVSSFGGECRWQFPDSCLGDSAVAAVQQIAVDQGSSLRPRQQAGLHLVGDSVQYAYAISLTDSSLALRSGRQLIASLRNPALATAGAAARASLYQLDGAGLWNRLPGPIDSVYASAATPRLGTLLPLASSDSSGPVITASVDKKATGWSDTIKVSRPQYSVIIADADGVNLDSVKLRNDGQWVPRSAFNLPVNPGDTRTVPLTYAPDYANGRHELEIFATDNLGNSSRARLVNTVALAFDIYEIANYPNPVDGDFTTFYFFVGGHADDYELRLFTVAGRRIKTIQGGFSSGIQTFTWDLTDGDGRRVANGVYFYTLTVRQGSTTIKKTGKLAVLR